jgi:hypothetical protein
MSPAESSCCPPRRRALRSLLQGCGTQAPRGRGSPGQSLALPGHSCRRGARVHGSSVVFLFATTYFVMADTTVSGFTESLTRTDALYFLVTTLATVGYGDIAAKSENVRRRCVFANHDQTSCPSHVTFETTPHRGLGVPRNRGWFLVGV